MDFLASTWWIWLAFWFALAVFITINTVGRVVRVRKSRFLHSDFSNSSLFSGLIPMAISGVLASACLILAVIGLIARFITMAH